jgi:hypothetical protein
MVQHLSFLQRLSLSIFATRLPYLVFATLLWVSDTTPSALAGANSMSRSWAARVLLLTRYSIFPACSGRPMSVMLLSLASPFQPALFQGLDPL